MALPSLQQLTTFRAVAEFGGFSHAADELGMSQPAVSQQVRLLEQQLGVQLFERRPRGTVLTDAGEALLPLAVRSLDAIDALTLEAERQASGLTRLRVGAIPTIAPYLLPSAIAWIREQRPELQLQIAEQRTDELMAAIEARQLDLAFIATEEDSDVVDSIRIADDPFLLAVSERDVLARRRSVKASTLLEREVLLLQDGHCLRGQAQFVCAAAGRPTTHDVSASSLTTVCQMVAAGQGVTLLPKLAVEVECRQGSGVRAIPIIDGAHGRVLRIAWRRTSPLAPQLCELAGGLRRALA